MCALVRISAPWGVAAVLRRFVDVEVAQLRPRGGKRGARLAHLEASVRVGGIGGGERILVRQQRLHGDERLDDDVLHALPQRGAAVACST